MQLGVSADDFFYQLAQVEFLEFQLELACTNSGDIEQMINQ